jgi:hypothetical protein
MNWLKAIGFLLLTACWVVMICFAGVMLAVALKALFP